MTVVTVISKTFPISHFPYYFEKNITVTDLSVTDRHTPDPVCSLQGDRRQTTGHAGAGSVPILLKFRKLLKFSKLRDG